MYSGEVFHRQCCAILKEPTIRFADLMRLSNLTTTNAGPTMARHLKHAMFTIGSSSQTVMRLYFSIQSSDYAEI